jgi:glucan phosphoethanolaminetransferase (alkaline phosphatase superfamily)
MLMESRGPKRAWLYFSDHGQDVSHTSNYSGHNYKAPQQWAVPLLFWSGAYRTFPDLSSPLPATYILSLLQ